jgi:putative transposase
VFTKLILGFYLSFDPPSTFTVLEALKHSITPKSYVRERYPNIRHSWDAYGLPEKLVVDNALEHHGNHLELACKQLGINLQYSPRGKPWYRNSVERGFGTIASQLFHRLPGTTFSNILSKADYNPYKHAIVPANTADEIVHKYLIDVYQRSPHRGVMGVPALRWERSIEKWPPSLPAKASDLDFVLSHSERRVISPSGIELDCLLYNDDRLALLRSEAKAREKGNPVVDVKRYGRDLSKIGVHDEKRDRYLTVLALDHEYTRGLTLWQHKVIRKYVRKQLKEDVDIVSLCRAKLEIQEIVEREWHTVKTSRARMARFRQEGVQDRRLGIGGAPTTNFPN